MFSKLFIRLKTQLLKGLPSLAADIAFSADLFREIASFVRWDLEEGGEERVNEKRM